MKLERVSMPCACGCGTMLTPALSTCYKILRYGAPGPYVLGHHQRGKKHHAWKGGKAMTTTGYVLVLRPGHSESYENDYALEHRVVMSDHLGRPLRSDEVVHHINGKKTDNRIENLSLTDPREHASTHQGKGVTPEIVAEIRRLAGTMSQRRIGKRFGVSQPTVSEIISGKRWPTRPK